MRGNIEDARVWRALQVAPRYNNVTQVLTGDLIIEPEIGGGLFFLDAGGSARNIYLPAILEGGGHLVYVFNTGDEILSVRDSVGVLLGTVVSEAAGLFVSDRVSWTAISLTDAGRLVPDQVITASGTVTVAATDRFILLNKAIQSNTPFTLPTLASRNYLSLVVWDYSGNGGDLTFTPNGAEKINTLSSWVSSSRGPGYSFRIELLPITGVGWLIK